jgi:hypothetical protein
VARLGPAATAPQANAHIGGNQVTGLSSSAIARGAGQRRAAGAAAAVATGAAAGAVAGGAYVAASDCRVRATGGTVMFG